MLPYVYRVTKYDPADRDEHGGYTGTEESVSDHGPVEAAYLQAVAAFAEDTGVHQLTIREPHLAGLVHFGLEPAVEGHGLAGLFPPDLTGFHDGAQVPVAVGLELVRAMLRDNGAWCRLEVEDVFAVHVGWDQYVYVGTSDPCERALSRTRELGLFPERLEASPYDAALDEEPGEQRPADDIFWARLRWCIATHQAAILEEGYIGGASRWHRLTGDTVDAVRAELTPRAQLTVWPDLSTDVDEILAALPDEGSIELVWEDEHGQITSTIADETQFTELAAQVTGARAATALSLYVEERHPLFTAVLPDIDGVLRARWRTEPTPSDHNWAFLKTLHRGQICNGTVSKIANFGVFVDIGGFTAMINIPELSWRPVDHPSAILTVGQEITAQVLDVDMVRERVALSLKALQEDPMPQIVQRVGQIVRGRVTKLTPFGAFVRIDDRPDGFEGLVHNSELAAGHVDKPEDVVQVGDDLYVKVIDVDPKRRRITLSRKQAVAAS
ncbi:MULTISPECIES: S1 RNA-binding domain-containing protein [Nocardia]|uniref:RNA-binding protein n=1 Tax=Nocardia donostiensis TaxID=1538463 RepID=A0A1W0B1L2_9NOCA|nr:MULTISPECIES: S1 RNA-binding domain-containing protein [Nocardia]ONM47891.1 RNA-binding protein [Nocardia donostiensis]OQS16347.1 RNA-binding protein [Nocardia donostiensis]OQS17712.1 RNA-binding protein [Nocardia donostiensis]